jgi:Tfp pilus assembly protein PilF
MTVPYITDSPTAVELRSRTLADLLAEPPDPHHPRARWLRLFEAVAKELGYAHLRGVSHGDLKPTNVLVGAFDEVRVINWPPDRPPAAGDDPAGPGHLDRGADVFALGAILCEILTGRPPGPGVTAGGSAPDQLAEALDRLDRSGADPGLTALARDCLAPDPVDRPADAGAVAEALADYQSAWEERARHAEARLAAARARSRWGAVGLGAGLLLVLGLAGGWWLSLDRAGRRAEADREEVEQRAQAERGEAERAAAAEAALPAVAAARDAGRWAEARAALARAERGLGTGGPEDLRRRLRESWTDLEIAEDLESARLRGAEPRGPSDPAGVHEGFAAAFARHGLTDDLPPEELAARVRGSGAREALVAALDDWWPLHPDPAARARLRAAADRADPDGWRAELRKALAAGDRAALERLAADRAAEDQPAAALARLARALGAGRGDAAAEALLRRARRKYPADFWVHNLLGRCLAARPAAPEAEGCYRSALALRPESAGAHYDLGRLLAGQPKRAAEAESELRESARLRPDLAEVRNALGELLAGQPGRAGEAHDELREALRLRPEFPEAQYNVGRLLADQPGWAREAEAAYREALRLRPEFPEAHYRLGLLLQTQPGRSNEAEEEFRAAVRQRPGFAEAHNSLGVLLARRPGREEEAEAEFRQAIEHRPDLVEAHNNLGLLLSHKPGQEAEAEGEFRRAITLKPDDAVAHGNLGMLLSRQPGKAAEAEAECRHAITLWPDYAEAHCNLGLLLSRQPGKAAAAEAECRHAITLKPDLAEAHYNLGLLLSRQPGKAAAAEAEYGQAIRVWPDYPEAHCNLGQLLRERGRFAEALAELRRGHQLGTRRPGWPYPSERWVREAERLADLEARLPALLRGDERPAPEDLHELAVVCWSKGLFAAAARFAAAQEAAFGTGAGTGPGFGYHAARTALLAAAGRGDGARAPAKAKASLRRQALDWLRADLALWAKQPAGDPKVAAALTWWRSDPDLAAARDDAALAALPEQERREWRQFWAEVDALLSGTGGR